MAMRSEEEVKRVIEYLYHRIPGKNANDIARVKSEDIDYRVFKKDESSVPIPRRQIDLYLENENDYDANKPHKDKLVEILKNL